MKTIEEMSNWNYAMAWEFFSENAVNRYIPETELYIRSSKFTETVDVRDDKDARNKILEVIKDEKSLILIDGSSLNGKSTFSKRLANHINAEIVDIDIICKYWMDERLEQIQDPIKRYVFMSQCDELTDIYILENLEKIIREKSNKSVILVGSYMELIYRAIIAKTLGKYFSQVVSIYCCVKSFEEMKILLNKREEEYGTIPRTHSTIFEQYQYSKRLLENHGIPLGIGMDASFVADIHVSDMFV